MGALRMIKKIQNYYLKYTNPVKWARSIGVNVGENTTFPPDIGFPSEPYLVSIGNNVQITSKVCFFTHGGCHVIRKDHPSFDFFGKVVVEDWVYIGCGSLIMPGVTIGEGTLVAAGSVVTKSTPPHTVVGGNPAKVLCTTDDFIKRNSAFDTKTGGMGGAKKKEFLLSLSDDGFIKK